MMTVTLTCAECGSAINVYPSLAAEMAECDICKKQTPVCFDSGHMKGLLNNCPHCKRKDFYRQKDFNRKIGVLLFVLAAILSIWTYGLSLIVLWLLDLFLFRKLPNVAICYKCNSVFRSVKNIGDIKPFNHEMNDRITYADHNFEGKPLEH